MKEIVGVLLGLLLCVSLHEFADAQEWNRFRGPNGTGVDSAQPLPGSLTEESMIWHKKLAGSGHSSPIVAGQQILATSYDDTGKLLLESFSLADGTPGWTWQTALTRAKMHRLNSPAASTPAADSKQVYVLAMEPDHLRLFAINLADGELVWERDFGPWQAQHGFATSPIVVGELVVFVNSQETVATAPEVPSEMIAVSAKDGKDVWRRKLADGKAAYAVPLVVKNSNDELVIVSSSTADGIYATSGGDGSALWNTPELPERTVGSAIVCGSRILASCGSGGGGKLMVGVGLETDDHLPDLEFHENLGYVPTPIVVNQWMFVFADNGVVSCVDPESGEYFWRERICDSFWGSPVSDGRNLYCIDAAGMVHVMSVAREFGGDRRFSLGEPSSSTPAIAGGRILIRSESQLWCFGGN